MDRLTPKDHAERIALFRAEIVGALARRELVAGRARGGAARARRAALSPARRATRRAPTPCRRSSAGTTRSAAGASTALVPEPRGDRGRGAGAHRRAARAPARHPPRAPERVGAAHPAHARRRRPPRAERRLGAHGAAALPRANGLDRRARRDGAAADACACAGRPSGPARSGTATSATPARILIDGKSHPVRIHALLDDASRYVVALEAHHTEREVDMLGLFVRALRRHGPPDALYLDNGSTYRGDILRTACARLGIALLHAKPYDAPARGKMERFWRTLREGCLDFLGDLASLHDVNVRLWAFLDEHYHRAPHAGLLGRAPGGGLRAKASAARRPRRAEAPRARSPSACAAASAATAPSPLDGADWELDQGFLAGRLVTVARCLVDPASRPGSSTRASASSLHPVDPVRNARRRRAAVVEPHHRRAHRRLRPAARAPRPRRRAARRASRRTDS